MSYKPESIKMNVPRKKACIDFATNSDIVASEWWNISAAFLYDDAWQTIYKKMITCSSGVMLSQCMTIEEPSAEFPKSQSTKALNVGGPILMGFFIRPGGHSGSSNFSFRFFPRLLPLNHRCR